VFRRRRRRQQHDDDEARTHLEWAYADEDEGSDKDAAADDAQADETDWQATAKAAAQQAGIRPESLTDLAGPAEWPGGPWDVSDEVDDRPRIDLGGMRVPTVAGMDLRVDVSEEQIVAATVVLGESALQIHPFAAPRTLGIWDEVRREIAASITRDGGTVDEVDGPFGPELRAKVPVRAPDGRSGVQAARFVGADGPRWFLRGVFTGQAATDTAAGGPLEEVFRGIVVVRGDQPMPPREPLELRLPQDATKSEGGGQEGHPPIDPFKRGPEITEVR
jgi:Protein of unknown function (DUF3710)